jgi:hypothetical protein
MTKFKLATVAAIVIAYAMTAINTAEAQTTGNAQVATQKNNQRFAVYNAYIEEQRVNLPNFKNLQNQFPGTILVDRATGRSWELVRIGEGTRWDPVHFLPTQMSSLGTPLMGGTITPEQPEPSKGNGPNTK